MVKSDSARAVQEPPSDDNLADMDLEDEMVAARIFQEGKQVLVELSTDPAIIEVDDSEIEAESRSTMMRTLTSRSMGFRAGFSRFASASPPEIDIKPIDEETEVEETEEERLKRERLQEENRKLEMIKKDIRKKEIELLRVYEIGKVRTREYRQTENDHIRDKNAFARSLWRTRKSHLMNPILKEYKNHMFRVSLPCHDTSNTVLASEGKILKSVHSYQMVKHQMELLREQQPSLISFLHKGAMKEAQKDRDEAISALKEQVFDACKRKDELTNAYEAVMTAQGALITFLRLHESNADGLFKEQDNEQEQKEASKSESEDFKSTKLRRSAELRIEAKYGNLKERRAKNEVRQEVFNKTLQNVEQIERTYMERAKHVSGEIESVLSSIQVRMETEELTERSDEEDEDQGTPVESTSVDESKDESSSHSTHSSFVDEEEEHRSEHHEDDESHRVHDSSSQLSVDEHSQSSRRRKVEKKDKINISARLEILRAKRRQQELEQASRLSGKKESSRGSVSSSRRDELLKRARSARSTRLMDQKLLSPRTKERTKASKMAEIRKRREERAAAAVSAIPPATLAEGS